MNGLMTIDECAEYLGIKKPTIYAWCHVGFLPYVKVGKYLRFKKEDIDNWLEKRTHKGRRTFKVAV